MKIILIGFMGAGKTTVGKIIAERLGLSFIDMDHYINERTNFASIPEIFEKKGEPHFRELEKTAAGILKNQKHAVISCGGGIIHAQGALEDLKTNGGKCVYLHSSFEGLQARITNISSRPLFQDPQKARRLYDARLGTYKENACITVDTEGLTPQQAAQKIITGLAGGEPKKFAIIGSPVAHSLSPVMHNAGYKALGLDEIYSFTAVDVAPGELKNFIETQGRNYGGFSVTMPHKTEIIKYLNEASPSAKEIGAVNTVVNKNGAFKGYNTDFHGVLAPLATLADIRKSKVAIIGAGGAARAAVYAAKHAKGLMVFNRTQQNAMALAKGKQAEIYSFEDFAIIEGADIIINTTPVGMGKDLSATPLPQQYMRKGQIVFDMIYNPLETRLIKEAKAKGLKTITGEQMLLAQAYKQFEYLTNFKAPRAAMQAALNAALEEKANAK